MRHARLRLGLAAAALSALLGTARAAQQDPIVMTGTDDYARTVSAVCTVMTPRDQASALGYFLKAAAVDKAPTKAATETFCGAFKTALPLTAAEANTVLDATAAAGGAPAPMKKKKDKDKPPPPPPADGGGRYFHIKVKIFGIEFELERGEKQTASSSSSSSSDDDDDGNDTAGEGGDRTGGTPPFNPRSS
ncbi:hypothetical protein sos41_41420 [Alphaproteobacteria bacterium SO-S41]|nr:hypothetical protein sos41_41420 [Alphaproteobacteria bacterium SO-S41]